jgi:hypothetical protein
MKKMNEKTAIAIMVQLQKLKYNIRHLNEGGCGVFACYFANTLLAAGYDAKIIQIHRDTPTDIFSLLLGGKCEDHGNLHPQENNKNMHIAATKNLNPDICDVKVDTHYCIKVDDFYFESDGFSENHHHGKSITLGGYHYQKISEISIPDFEYISITNRGDLWCELYNPNQNDLVKNIIESSLEFLN